MQRILRPRREYYTTITNLRFAIRCYKIKIIKTNVIIYIVSFTKLSLRSVRSFTTNLYVMSTNPVRDFKIIKFSKMLKKTYLFLWNIVNLFLKWWKYSSYNLLLSIMILTDAPCNIDVIYWSGTCNCKYK